MSGPSGRSPYHGGGRPRGNSHGGSSAAPGGGRDSLGGMSGYGRPSLDLAPSDRGLDLGRGGGADSPLSFTAGGAAGVGRLSYGSAASGGVAPVPPGGGEDLYAVAASGAYRYQGGGGHQHQLHGGVTNHPGAQYVHGGHYPGGGGHVGPRHHFHDPSSSISRPPTHSREPGGAHSPPSDPSSAGMSFISPSGTGLSTSMASMGSSISGSIAMSHTGNAVAASGRRSYGGRMSSGGDSLARTPAYGGGGAEAGTGEAYASSIRRRGAGNAGASRGRSRTPPPGSARNDGGVLGNLPPASAASSARLDNGDHGGADADGGADHGRVRLRWNGDVRDMTVSTSPDHHGGLGDDDTFDDTFNANSPTPRASATPRHPRFSSAFGKSKHTPGNDSVQSKTSLASKGSRASAGSQLLQREEKLASDQKGLSHLRSLVRRAISCPSSTPDPGAAVFFASALHTKSGLPEDAYLFARALECNGEGRRAVMTLERSGLLTARLWSGGPAGGGQRLGAGRAVQQGLSQPPTAALRIESSLLVSRCLSTHC